MNKKIFYVTVLLLFVVLNTCNVGYKDKINSKYDWNDIKKKGKIVVVTNYNTVDYFVYKGNPMGFQFELIRDFAEYSGLNVEIIVNNDFNSITDNLLAGKYDIVALNLPVNNNYSKYISFTQPLMSFKPVLVQLKPASEADEKKYISDINQLNGKTVIVKKGSAYVQRLKNLSEENNLSIDIVEVPESDEQLIRFVATGEVDYVVCDNNLAKVNQKYFPQLDVSLEIGLSQNMAWAVRKEAKNLLSILNGFFETEKKSSRLALIKDKYYNNQYSNYIVNSEYFVLYSEQLSPYDELIKTYSTELNWDWRLLAALIYQESKFNPESKSHRGAIGLMQLMPTTALLFGADSVSIYKPATNIEVGVKYLKWLEKKFMPIVPNKEERIKFVLAAYNIGLGHVIDAQLLANKYGKDMTKWDDVKHFLLNKSLPEFYKDSVVQFGYCEGVETNNYVSGVIDLYMHYKNVTSKFW